MLDNARAEQQVRPLLPGEPGCLVLLTSRSPFRQLAGNGTTTPAKAKRVAVTGMADGRVQVAIVGWDGNVYRQTRNADTTWTGFQPLNGMGTTTPAAGKDVAIGTHVDGTAQVLIIGNDDGIYHRVRSGTSWTPFRMLAGMGDSPAKGSRSRATPTTAPRWSSPDGDPARPLGVPCPAVAGQGTPPFPEPQSWLPIRFTYRKPALSRPIALRCPR